MAKRTQTKRKSSSSTRKGRTATTARRKTSSRSTARRSTSRPGRRSRLTITPAMRKVAREMSQMMSEKTVPADAIALLKQDHREVEALFEQFEHLESNAEKAAMAAKICLMLKVHARIEEELLYPAAQDESDTVEEDLVDEAIVEHASAKQLIAEIEKMKPSEDLYDAKVKVLGEYVKHHVKEEENELFPQLQQSDLDLHEMGRELMERKLELLMQMTSRA
jgi:hemerythrin-like domain-containing protein